MCRWPLLRILRSRHSCIHAHHAQWVLSFPWPLRLLFAARPDLLTRVLGVVTRALSTAAKRRAGLRAGADAETGVVTFIQRFGSALNLNIHLHLLVLDGAYTFVAGRPRFHRARAPTDDEIERLLDALIRRVVRTLTAAPGILPPAAFVHPCTSRAGALVVDPDEEGASPYLNLERPDDDALAVLESASVRYRIAVGPIAGRKTLRLQVPGALSTATRVTKRLTATRDGFSLNAAVACRAGERKKLERLCRYVARPPLALERLDRDGDGLVVHRLKRPFHDGTTKFLFEPLDFLARLAALVPRPRSHLLRYHGVLAPNARHRRLVVPTPVPKPAPRDDKAPVPQRGRTPMSWIQRLACRVRHRPEPVPPLRRRIARAGGDQRPACDCRHPRAHRHPRRTRSAHRVLLTPCAALPRASRPRQSCRRPTPAWDAPGLGCARVSPTPISAHPGELSVAFPLDVSRRRHRRGRRAPALTLDPHPEVRDTAPQGGFGRSEFLSAGLGEGVTQDPVEAFAWFSLGAARGDPNAAKNRDLTAQELSQEAVARGRDRAREIEAQLGG